MSALQIKLFGKFELSHGGLTVLAFSSNRAKELFCYMLLHRNKSYPREALAEVLWGKDPGMQGRKFLRQTLWEIQSALKSQFPMDDLRLLSASSNWIQFDPNVSLELDVAEFEAKFNCAQGVPAARLERQHIEALRKAEEVYRGDLLEGWYWDWCSLERDRLKEMYLMILEKLMLHAELTQEYELGLSYGLRILEADNLIESAHQLLMRLYYLAGYRVKALRQFERCTAILSQELGVSPSLQTQRLYEQIKADRFEDLPMMPPFANTTSAVPKYQTT